MFSEFEKQVSSCYNRLRSIEAVASELGCSGQEVFDALGTHMYKSKQYIEAKLARNRAFAHLNLTSQRIY